MVKHVTVLLALLLGLAPHVLGSAARAQDATSEPAAPPDEVRKEASARFRRGVELFQEGAYRAALVEFQRAYAIAPDFRLLYNIGQAQVLVQDYLGANQSYERYLTDGGSEVEPARRTEVETALVALRERVGRLVIRVNQPGADVFVDEQRVGTSPLESTVAVNIGRHRVYARMADGSADEEVVDVAGGDMREIELAIVIAPAAPVPVAPRPEGRDPAMAMRRGALASWAAGGALAIGAVVTGVMTRGKVSELEDALDTRPPEAEADAKKVNDLRGSAETLALTTDIMGGAAIALVVTGTVLWFLGDKRDGERASARSRLTIGVSARSVSVGGRF